MHRAFTLLTSTTTWEKRLAKSGIYFYQEKKWLGNELNSFKWITKTETNWGKAVVQENYNFSEQKYSTRRGFKGKKKRFLISKSIRDKHVIQDGGIRALEIEEGVYVIKDLLGVTNTCNRMAVEV